MVATNGDDRFVRAVGVDLILNDSMDGGVLSTKVVSCFGVDE